MRLEIVRKIDLLDLVNLFVMHHGGAAIAGDRATAIAGDSEHGTTRPRYHQTTVPPDQGLQGNPTRRYLRMARNVGRANSVAPVQRGIVAASMAAGAGLKPAAAMAGTSTASAARIATEEATPTINRLMAAKAAIDDALAVQRANRERLQGCTDPAQWAAAGAVLQPLFETIAGLLQGCQTARRPSDSVLLSSKSEDFLINETPAARAARSVDRILAEAVDSAPKPKSWAEIERAARVRASLAGTTKGSAGGGPETPVVALVALPSPAARATEGVVLDVYAAPAAQDPGEEP